ncbi:hypothetical protein GOBAR_DD29033 [Gossypium barbadense]|nr:hypothetical protein GOBAR_DD29033 [Gossypium barbadense]
MSVRDDIFDRVMQSLLPIDKCTGLYPKPLQNFTKLVLHKKEVKLKKAREELKKDKSAQAKDLKMSNDEQLTVGPIVRDEIVIGVQVARGSLDLYEVIWKPCMDVESTTSKVFSVPSVLTNEPTSGLGGETTQNEGAIENHVPAPYPWATTRRARVHDLNYLQSNNIRTINGQVECKVCQTVYTIEYDIEEKLKGIKDFVLGNRWRMNDRAPKCWMYPRLDNCKNCGSSLKPVIGKKRDINWLFLVLGQMLGCCKLSDLKYFCKHTKNHRTGAKNRLLYIAYIELCKQLCPHGPFHL